MSNKQYHRSHVGLILTWKQSQNYRLPTVGSANEHHLLDLIEQWKADLFDLNFKDVDGWSDANRALASAQYAYIKFGLILEKIRNECAYKYCQDKLKTFAQFCRQKLKLTVWQANSYIEAADTAMYLADSGFEVLPKNYSQAAVLTKAKKLETGYYQDHPMLEQIWGTLVANTAAEKITANAIEKAIDPDYEEKQSLRLPKRLLARAKIQARLKGITVEEYLDELMDADADEGCPVDPETAIPVTPEMSQIIDELELQWLEPKSQQITTTTTPIYQFDEKPSFWISIVAFIFRSRGCHP